MESQGTNMSWTPPSPVMAFLLCVPARAGSWGHSDIRSKPQPWTLGLGDQRMANILTCCSWPNNWGIREACPKICRKERGRVMGDQGWGRKWGIQARMQENLWLAGLFNLLLRLAEAQVLGLTWLPPGMGCSLLLGLSVTEDL